MEAPWWVHLNQSTYPRPLEHASKEEAGTDLAISLQPLQDSKLAEINVRSKATSTLEANAQWVVIFIASARTRI